MAKIIVGNATLISDKIKSDAIDVTGEVLSQLDVGVGDEN